jgi:hypothetical protein
MITIDQEKLDIGIDEFEKNDIIIIKSGTATSKTKLIGKLSPKSLNSSERKCSLSFNSLKFSVYLSSI